MVSGRGQAIAAAALSIGLLTGAGVLALRQMRTPGAPLAIEGLPRASYPPGTLSPTLAPGATGPAQTEVIVHIVGAVRHPGVYHLRVGSRNDDALRAAGGALPDADTDSLNLAALVEDGAQLRVGGKGPAPAEPTPGPDRPRSAPGVRGSDRPEKLTNASQGTVNINRASLDELQRLPGVGPATARRIVDYRQQNGPFTSGEQLLDVSGIGDKKLASMRPFVRVR